LYKFFIFSTAHYAIKNKLDHNGRIVTAIFLQPPTSEHHSTNVYRHVNQTPQQFGATSIDARAKKWICDNRPMIISRVTHQQQPANYNYNALLWNCQLTAIVLINGHSTPAPACYHISLVFLLAHIIGITAHTQKGASALFFFRLRERQSISDVIVAYLLDRRHQLSFFQSLLFNCEESARD
jgi:hypothetical protein